MMSDSIPTLQLFPCSLYNILRENQHNQKPAKPTPKPVCNMGKKRKKKKINYTEPVLPWLYAQELTSPILSCRRHPVFKLTSMKIKHNAKTGFSFSLSYV